MLAEPQVRTLSPRPGQYGLRSSTDLTEMTSTTLWGPGDQMIPQQTYEYGTNQWPHQMYLPSWQLSSGWSLRSLPYTIPTVNPFHPTQADPCYYVSLAPGYSYPIPVSYYQDTKGSSQMNLTHWILTPLPRTSSPTSSDSSRITSLTHSSTTIGGTTEQLAIPSTPTEMTMTGLNSPSETERSLGPNELLPGTSGGRILSADYHPQEGEYENPWVTTSPPNEATPSWGLPSNDPTPSWLGSLLTRTGASILPLKGIRYATLTSVPLMSRGNLRMHYAPSPPSRTTNYETVPPASDFCYDPDIFRYHPSQNPEDVPDFFMHSMDTLPDSPPEEVR